MADNQHSKQDLAELLLVLLEVSQSDSWRLWRGYIASSYEAAMDAMENASNWYEFVEARAGVRALRSQLEIVPDMIRQTEVFRKTPDEEG